MHPRSVWCFLLFIHVSYWSYSQDAALYTTKLYSTQNGLPQSGIRQIVMDRFGYCWLATEEGLIRFDGKRFERFGSPDIQGLHNDRIRFMSQDSNGNIFASTLSGQVIAISQASPLYSPKPRIFNKKPIMVPVIGYASITNPALDSILRTLQNRENRDVLLSAFTRQGEMYLTYNNKLIYINGNSISKIAAGNITNSYNFSILGNDTYIILDAGNKVRAWRNGEFLPRLNRLEGDMVRDKVQTGNQIKLFWCHEGTYLYAGNNLYLVKEENGSLKTQKVLHDIKIEGVSLICYVPSENKYLLYSYLGQPNLYEIQLSKFSIVKSREIAANSSFYAHSKLSDTEVFAKNYGFSLSGKVRKIPANTDQSNDNRAQYLDVDQNLYFEKDFNLVRYNLRTGKQDSLLRLDATLRSIFLAKGSQDFIFCTEKSVNRFATEKKQVTSRKPPFNTKITTCLQLDDSHFLLGTERGLKWFDFTQNKIERSILDSASIWSIYRDGDQRFWISTYGRSFFLYDKGALFPFPAEPSGYLRTVHSFVDDGRGNFWMPTNNGLFKTSKAELLAYALGQIDRILYVTYTTDDGLLSNEFNGGSTPSYVWLADSLLSLPSQDGLVWFYPHRIAQPFPRNTLYIEDVALNSRPSGIDTLARLPPGNHQIEFRVGSPYFGNPNNLTIEYFLEGYSSKWLLLSADGKAIFQNLPADTYRLRFRKRKNANYAEFDYLEFPIRIAPYFYNTWWFYSLAAVSLVGFGYLLTRWRIANLKKQTYVLEQKVQERTQSLNRTVTQLQESQLRLKESNDIKDRIVSMVLHDLRSPIRFLEMMGTRLAKNHESLAKATLSERLNEIKNSASSIYSYTNQFLTWTSAQHGLYTIRFQWVDLYPLLLETSDLYTEIAHYHQNELIVQPTSVKCYTDAYLLTAILRNLVDNAIKHTSQGKITLAVQQHEEKVHIIVADTGTGMTPMQVDTFLGKKNDYESVGLGSYLVRDLVQKLEGSLQIESQLGKGTTFTIVLSENHLPNHEDAQGW